MVYGIVYLKTLYMSIYTNIVLYSPRYLVAPVPPCRIGPVTGGFQDMLPQGLQRQIQLHFECSLHGETRHFGVGRAVVWSPTGANRLINPNNEYMMYHHRNRNPESRIFNMSNNVNSMQNKANMTFKLILEYPKSWIIMFGIKSDGQICLQPPWPGGPHLYMVLKYQL